MRCVRPSRYLSLLAIAISLLCTTALPAEESKNNAIVPVPRADQKDWMERHEAINARVKQGNVDLIFIGDSITEGWEGAGKPVWDKFYGHRHAVNAGISSDRTQNVLWRLDHGNIDGISPKLAVLMIGTNTMGNTPEQVAEGIQAIVTKLRTKLPETKVLVLGIFPRGPNSFDPFRQEPMKVNKLLPALADNAMVYYLDIGPMFLADDGTLSTDVMGDLLHPTAKGYEIWAEAIESTVTTLMGEKENAALPVPLEPGRWLQRYKDINARVKQGNVDLIFIGDSITEGWNDAGKEIWEKYYAKRGAVNLGISGDRTQHVLWRLDHGNIDGISPKLAVVMIGTNNSSRSTPEQTNAGIKAIVEKLRTKLPETKILLLGIFPRGFNNQSYLRSVNNKVNENIVKLADDKMVFYRDIGWRFSAGSDAEVVKDLMPDYLHLSANGYGAWAETIEPMVAKLIGQRESAVLPVPRDAAWWKKVDAINERIREGKVGLIFVGDSITEGWNDAGKEIWEKYYAKRGAVNLGISGDRTQHVLWRLDHGNIEGIAPALAVVLIGTNNIGPNTAAAASRGTPEEIAAAVKAIVEKLRSRLPQTAVLVLGIFPRGENKDSELRQLTAKTNELVAKLADDKMVFYLDIGPKLLAEDGTLTKEIMPDLLHPSPKAYGIWAEAIEPMVAKFMGGK